MLWLRKNILVDDERYQIVRIENLNQYALKIENEQNKWKTK